MILNKKSRKSKYIQFQDSKVICYICKLYKNIEDFDVQNDNEYRKNLDRRCKCCKYIQHSNRKLKNRGKKDLDRILLERWHGVKDRSHKKGFTIDFDWTFLKEIWVKQNGICAISGINMTYEVDNGRVPTNLSIDKINCKLPYTKDNIQIVCMAVNQMKSDLNIEQLLFFCYNIIKYNES